jgi:GNAT superfamily N-acetyltransferase
MRLTRLKEEETVTFKEEMQEAFLHGFLAYYKDNNQMTNEREQSQTCLNYAKRGGIRRSQWQVLPDKDFYQSLEAKGAEAYEALDEDGQRVGGAIIAIDAAEQRGELSFLYVKVGVQSKGIGQAIWKAIEELHPETEIWETCTPYFDRRNIHFYINRLGFHAVEFFNEHHPDPHMPEQFNQEDGLFKFEKRMK